MHASHQSLTIPPRRREALESLLPNIGPYRRDVLHKRLRAAATACTDEALSLRRSGAAFASTTGLPRDVLPLPATTLPITPDGWEAEASIYEAMAEVVRTYRPTFTTP